nr:hypothetical protein [Tanacetum cinerariifolium]
MDNKKLIVNLESFRDMLHICPRVHGQSFDETPFEEEILAFIRFLGHSAATRTLTDVNINKNSNAYKEYYAIAIGAAPPKPKASVRKTRLTTSAKGKQPAKASKASKAKRNDGDGDDGDEGDDDNDDEDDDGEEGDDDDVDQEVKRDDEEEGNGEKDLGLNVGREEGHIKEEEDDESYKDVNINQGRGIQATLEVKDSHMTLNLVNSDGQQESSSVSSQFVTSMLNPTFDVGMEFILLKTLEANFSEFRQMNPFAEAVSAIPGIVHRYMDQQMNEAVKVVVQIQSDCLRDATQRENDEFLKTIDENIKNIIKEPVKEYVQVQVSKILPRIKQTINEQLEAEVLTRSSYSSRTSYVVAADLSEMELKKILIEKKEGNKSIQCSKPSAGPYRGSKRRIEGKEPESVSTPTETATRSAGMSTHGSRSRQASASESAIAEEPMQTTFQMDEPSHLEFDTRAEDQPIVQSSQHPKWFSKKQKPPTLDHDWNKTLPATHGSVQPWISELAKRTDTCSSFNKLMDTPLEFSNFLINQLKVDTLTSELLAGLTYELMKGSCKSLVEVEYYLEEFYQATTDQLDWVNPEGQLYPHNLLKPLPLIPNNRGRRVIPFEHFINNDLEYLHGGASSRKYTTSVTKTKAADYGHIKWIEDLKHLDWITVQRDDDELYKFKEGDFKRLRIQDIEDMLPLLRRVEDLQLGVKSYQKKLNLTRPDTYCTDLKHKEAYSAYSNPRGFIYQNKDKRNRLMQFDELHKFSDGTLIVVRTALDDCLKGIRMQYLPTAQSSRVPKPLPEDLYDAIRQAYFVGMDTEFEPFKGKARTPKSPHIVAPPTCHVEESKGSGTSGARSTSSDFTAPLSPDHPLTHITPALVPVLRRTARMVMRVLPTMLPGFFVGIAEVAAISNSVFHKSEDDEEIEESLDFNNKSEGAEDEGPTAEDEDPVAGTRGHSMDDESRGLDDEGHGVEIDGLGLEKEEVVPEGQLQATLVVRTAVSAPLGLGYGALRRQELALKEDHVYSTFEVGQGSGSAPEPKRSERVSASRQPTLTTDSMLYIDVLVYPPPAPPVQTPPSPKWTSGSLLISPSPSVVPSPVSSPIILLIVPSPIALPMATSPTTILVDEDHFIEADRAQSSRVPIPLPEDLYDAIRHAYLVGTDTEFEPFEGKARTPKSPHIVAPPTCHVEESKGSGTSGVRSTSSDSTTPLSPDHPLTHTTPALVPILRRTARMVMRVLPTMLPGFFISIAEVAAMSNLVFRKSEDDEKIEDSLDFDNKSEGAEDEGHTVEDEDPSYGLDDEGHGVDDESRGLDDEGHGVEIDGLGLEEEEVVPEGQLQAALVVRTAMSTPLGLGYRALRRQELALKEDHVYSTFELGQGSGSAPEPKRSERVSASRQPTLTTDSMLYIDVLVYPPPAPPVQTPPSPKWTSGSLLISPSPSVVPSPVSSPIILLIVPSPIALPMATSPTTIPVDEDHFIEVGAQLELYRSILQDHTYLLNVMPPTLFVEIDRDVRELYTRSRAVKDEIFSQRYRFMSLEHEQERTTVTFRAL